MVCIERHFKDYHDRIKPGFFDGEKPLREKRDALGDRLERDLSKQAVPEDLGILGLRIQGSYQTRTTVKKVEGEIDIDVGLYLDVDIDTYGPVEVKRWVYEALKGHTHKVEFRRYCIRVYYQRGFHVDLSVYAGGSHGGDESYLAVGKRYSSSDQKGWERSNPRKLHDLIIDRHQANLKQELRDLNETLERANQSDSPHEACQILAEVFPEDFPTRTELAETDSEAQFEEPLPVNGNAAHQVNFIV